MSSFTRFAMSSFILVRMVPLIPGRVRLARAVPGGWSKNLRGNGCRRQNAGVLRFAQDDRASFLQFPEAWPGALLQGRVLRMVFRARIVADVGALDPEDYVFGDVGGVIGYALEIPRHEQRIKGLPHHLGTLVHRLHELDKGIVFHA